LARYYWNNIDYFVGIISTNYSKNSEIKNEVEKKSIADFGNSSSKPN
jgi:hypothetical protein